MAFILFDNSLRKIFYPLSLNNALAAIRCGIFTPLERWKMITDEEAYIHTADYLQALYQRADDGYHVWVDASLILNDELVGLITSLKKDEAIYDAVGLIAGYADKHLAAFDITTTQSMFTLCKEMQEVKRIKSAWHLTHHNDEILRYDYRLISSHQSTQTLSSTNNLLNSNNIFVGKSVNAEYAIINASAGPVYIGNHVTIMEGSIIKGPVALCDHAVVKAGAKIYGATTVGPHSVVGGEVKNSIFQSYSNKAHDGYVGDSVIGNWCNLGAGTSNSNIKNNGSTVNVWSYEENAYKPFAQKAGMMMGDYSKTSINTSVNTGTTIGICSNVFGAGLTPKLIQQFSWGMEEKNTYHFEKAITDIANWRRLKSTEISSEEIQVLKHIFDHL